MQQFLNTTLGGLTLGMVYAAFALALVLIWRSTRIVNFAQAPMAMLTTFIALAVIDAGHSYWLGLRGGPALPAWCSARWSSGSSSARSRARPELNAVIVTLGLFVVLHAAGLGRLRQPLPLVPGAVRHPRHRGRRHHHRR